MRYRRATLAGATYFFTVNLADRRADHLTRHSDLLPIAPLPNAAFTFGLSAVVDAFCCCKSARGSGLNQRPTHRVVGVIFGQHPHSVNMIGQNDHGINMKRMRHFDTMDNITEQIAMSRQMIGATISQIDREE